MHNVDSSGTKRAKKAGAGGAGAKAWSREISAGGRFEFGKNWEKFLKTLNDQRIKEAERSLKMMLGCENLEGKRFLDIGSGSGLLSLAARRLGALVHSFDYDPRSVGCARELKRRFFPGDNQWTIEEGSVLDEKYMKSLGKFDIVYSWGVLHHTGDMWRALEDAHLPVGPNGKLFIAIYNDQGLRSRFWRAVKKTYCSGPAGKLVTSFLFIPYFFIRSVVAGFVRYGNPVRYYIEYKRVRGMSVVHDWIDWLGGYPFEVATPQAIIDFYRRKGYSLQMRVLTKGLGNNQFVFQRG